MLHLLLARLGHVARGTSAAEIATQGVAVGAWRPGQALKDVDDMPTW